MRVLALLVILAMTAKVAFAERDPVRAKQLFEEGRSLFKDEKWDAACAKFEHSLALDDATGTKVNLAECIVHQAKLVEAYYLFRDAISEDEAAGGNEKRLEFSRERRAALVAQLVTVRVTVEQPDGVTLTINDETIDSSLAKPVVRIVAPGEVVVTARARSHPKWTKTETAKAGAEVAFEVPTFTTTVETAPATGTQRRRSRVYLALGLGGGGLVTLIAGGLLGLEARRQFDATIANGSCTPTPTELLCGIEGANQIAHAKDLTFAANALAVVGGALVISAVVVFVTAPRDRLPDRRVTVAPLLRSDAIGLVFDGRF